MNVATILKSKTFWGSLASAAAWAIAQPHLDATTLVQAGGAVLGAVGVRDAIAKGPDK